MGSILCTCIMYRYKTIFEKCNSNWIHIVLIRKTMCLPSYGSFWKHFHISKFILSKSFLLGKLVRFFARMLSKSHFTASQSKLKSEQKPFVVNRDWRDVLLGSTDWGKMCDSFVYITLLIPNLPQWKTNGLFELMWHNSRVWHIFRKNEIYVYMFFFLLLFFTFQWKLYGVM